MGASKTKWIKPGFLGGLFLLILATGRAQDVKTPEGQNQPLYEKGNLAPSTLFTGNAWVTGMVDNDSVFTLTMGEVYFEAGARSNWHLHPSGQILVVTSGVGYHQIKGQPIEVIHKGDVVKCPADVLHWHGASQDSSMSHIYILPNTEKGIVKWEGPVTDEEYANL